MAIQLLSTRLIKPNLFSLSHQRSTTLSLETSRSSLVGAVVAQLASARLSEREVPCSIFSDFNVCFDFPLVRVAIALNTRKTEHWQWQGGWRAHRRLPLIAVPSGLKELPTFNKVTFTYETFSGRTLATWWAITSCSSTLNKKSSM